MGWFVFAAEMIAPILMLPPIHQLERSTRKENQTRSELIADCISGPEHITASQIESVRKAADGFR